jgi:hypothetical protein
MSAGDGENLITDTSKVARTLGDGFGYRRGRVAGWSKRVNSEDCLQGVEV